MRTRVGHFDLRLVLLLMSAAAVAAGGGIAVAQWPVASLVGSLVLAGTAAAFVMWSRTRTIPGASRMAGCVVAAVALAAGIGWALGAGSLSVLTVLLSVLVWAVAALIGGLPAAGVAVVTLSLPFLGVPRLSGFADGLGLFTALIVVGLAPVALPSLLRHRAALLADARIRAILAFGALVALSLLIADRTDLSLELAKTYAGRAVLLPILLAAALVGLGRRRGLRTLEVAGTALVALGVAGAVLSVVQVGLEAGYPLSGDGEIGAIEQFVGSRAVGLSESPGTWASFLVLPFGFAVVRCVARPGPLRLVMLAAIAGALLLTGLRSAWVAMAVALIVSVMLSDRRRQALITVAVVAVAGAAMLAIPNFRSFVSGGAPGSSQGVSVGGGRLAADESARSRLILLKAEVRQGLRHPVTGVGLGNIGANLTATDVRDDGERLGVTPGVPIEKHIVYVGLFAELGFPGAILFVIVLATGVIGLLRARRDADVQAHALVDGLLTALVATMVIALTTEADRQAFLWWTLGAASAVIVLLGDRDSSSSAAASRPSRLRRSKRLTAS